MLKFAFSLRLILRILFWIFFFLEGDCFIILCCSLPYINTVQPQVYIRPLLPEPPGSSPPHPARWSRGTRLSFLCRTANSHLLSILHTVIHTLPCYALSLSHPLLPPLCPKVCSLCLHFHCGPANRFIRTIFLFSIFYEVSIKIFCLFLNWFIIELKCSLYILDMYFFCQCFANIFPQP